MEDRGWNITQVIDKRNDWRTEGRKGERTEDQKNVGMEGHGFNVCVAPSP